MATANTPTHHRTNAAQSTRTHRTSFDNTHTLIGRPSHAPRTSMERESNTPRTIRARHQTSIEQASNAHGASFAQSIQRAWDKLCTLVARAMAKRRSARRAKKTLRDDGRPGNEELPVKNREQQILQTGRTHAHLLTSQRGATTRATRPQTARSRKTLTNRNVARRAVRSQATRT